MKTPVKLFAAALFLGCTASALADVHYVDVNSTNAMSPYTNWSTAATIIQDAVDAAEAGDEIVVTNGNYTRGGRNGSRVVVDKPLSLRSVNGPQFTSIRGDTGLQRFRCVYLAGGGSLSGFSLNHGIVQGPGGAGGGAYGGTLKNCILTGNSVLSSGGGAFRCTLENCTLTGNSAADGGGAFECTLNNCTLTDNSAVGTGGPGSRGGARYCVENNCILFGNTNPFGCEDCGSPGQLSGNNWYGNPLFVDQASGILSLQSNSPCINAGNNSYVTSATDLDGNPRIVGSRVDIGAYEFQAVRYVDVNSTNATPPYSSWSTAATNIQDAVDVAVVGDEIVVTNGLYTTGGRATVSDSTLNRVVVDKPLSIRSVNGSESTIIRGGLNTRCVYLTNGASLTGFTLTRAFLDYSSGGGAWGGTLNNCTLTRNSAWGNGGGALYSILNNCVLTRNSSGVRFLCCDNFNATGGGAAHCTLNNCTLNGNWTVGGLPWGGGGAYGGDLNSCIVYFNSRRSTFMGTDFFTEDNYGGYAGLHNCCTTPNPYDFGNNIITNAPLFVDTNGWSNLRLQSNSPCINAGNNYNITSTPDLDGNPRIVGGTVDIGAYEYQSPASKISYAWLQQYALPIDGSADTTDPDGDGVDNYHEWLSGTSPTNRFSSPAQLTIIPSSANVILTWSTNAIGFTLQSATNLDSPVVWSTNSPAPIAISGQNIVTNPVSGTRQFYRLSQ